MKRKRPRKPRFPPRQSDVIIRPDGTVHVSFLWNDLCSVFRPLIDHRTGAATAIPEADRQPFSAPGRRRINVPATDYRKCRLCPNECGFDRTASPHPLCGDSSLRVATWGLVHGDERPISGDRGSGAIMFSGCPLRCPSCHNPEMVAAGVRVTPNRLAAMAWDLRKRGAENLQLLSPTVHIPALARVLRHLRGCGFDIPVVFKSSGYESVNELRKFEGLVDVYLPDVKFGPRSRWAESAGAADYFDEMRRAVEEMYRQTGPLALSPRGTAVRGVLVRCVPAPLPSRERGTIERFLRTLPKGIHVSHTAVFDRLG